MQNRTIEALIESETRTVHYRGYDVLPEVERVPEGELFGASWIISHCCLGKTGADGYEVRFLLSDNDHFSTREAAVRAARLRAIRTIDIDEVSSRHLAPVSASSLEPRRR